MSKPHTNPLEGEFRPPADVEEQNTRTCVKIQEEKDLEPTVGDNVTGGEDFSGTNEIKEQPAKEDEVKFSYGGYYFMVAWQLLDMLHQQCQAQLGANLPVDNADSVDMEGYGAIHYLVTKKHENKRCLLETLVIDETSDVNLTTKQGNTALHLAVEHNDLESAETLVSLEADVNKENLHGNTPLDLANVRRELKHTNWDIQSFHMENRTSNREKFEESTAVELVPITKERDSRANKIKELLLSIGAHTGRRSSSKKYPHKHNTKAAEALVQTASIPIIDEPVLKKIDTTYYIHEDILRRVRDVSQPVTSKEVLSTMINKMIQREEYRRKHGSRILCLDGGGIRGLIQLSVLQEIERRTKRKIVDIFDWIVGTSTGGIIALALSYGSPDHGRKTVCQLRDMYWSMKDRVFGDAQHQFLGFLAKGNTKTLQEMLQTCFGKYTTLSDTTCPKVLISAVYKKDTNLELHFFNNCFDNAYSNELVWKVARYTSAAPFYFKEFENYIDGGMLANNPSETALTVIQDFYHEKGEKIPISMVVSLGTGINPGTPLGEIDIKSNLFNPNAYYDLMDVMVAAVDHKQRDHYNCAARCREQGIDYFRFDPELKEKITADSHNSQSLHKMIRITRQYMNSKKDDLDRLVQMLMESE